MEVSAEQVHLCLALTAYAGSKGEAARDPSCLRRSIASWLERWPATRGHQLIWGPASFRLWWQPSAPALMVFATRPSSGSAIHVVVRGGAPVSLWDHNLESLACLEQEPWAWTRKAGNLAPAVCAGMLDLLAVVRELTPEEQQAGAGQTLADYLSHCVADSTLDRKLPVHVCGHGMGGALAPLVTLWLHDTQGHTSARDLAWDPQQRAKLHCTAFAGPAIGNPDFADYIEERLGPALELVHNSLDPAPALWDTHDMAGIPGLYQPYVEEPDLIRVIADALANEIERCGVEYEQPEARVLEGRINRTLPPTFAAQAEYQHLHAYVELLGLEGQVDVDAIFERPSGADGGPVAQ